MTKEVKKKGNIMVEVNSPVSRVNLASRGYSIHLGPFMPFNSGEFPISTAHSNYVITTNSTIFIEAPQKR